MSDDKCPKCGMRMRREAVHAYAEDGSAIMATEIHRVGGEDCVTTQLQQARAENERLEAIVDKLPKTADGVPVVPGMELWNKYSVIHGAGPEKGKEWTVVQPRIFDGGEWDTCVSFTLNPDGCEVWSLLSDCYSTHEAAEVAQQQDCK